MTSYLNSFFNYTVDVINNMTHANIIDNEYDNLTDTDNITNTTDTTNTTDIIDIIDTVNNDRNNNYESANVYENYYNNRRNNMYSGNGGLPRFGRNLINVHSRYQTNHFLEDENNSNQILLANLNEYFNVDNLTISNDQIIPTTNDRPHILYARCLGCNVRTNMVQGSVNTERTCMICLESTNVCYGCQTCLSSNLPSCCTNCYNEYRVHARE